MRRSVQIEIAASPDEVLAGARRVLAPRGTVGGAGDTLTVDLADLPTETARLTVVAASAPDGRAAVELTQEIEVGIPFFAWAFRPLLAIAQRRTLRHSAESLRAAVEGGPPPRPPKPVPGLPASRFSADQTSLLSSAAVAAAIAGFGSALYGQQTPFVKDTFHASDTSLGVSLSITRLGVLVAVFALALADRFGRRRVLIISTAGVCIGNLLSAAAPTLGVFTVFQLLTRGFVNTTIAVAGVAAIEEAPEGARGFSTAMIGLASGLGFAFAVVTLPLSDVAEPAWRGAFALSGLSIVLLPALRRRLPESVRYLRVAASGIERGQVRELVTRRWIRRLALLGVIAFAANLLSAPASQLTNQYLKDDHGFSGVDISLFRTVTAGIPGLVGLLAALRLVEARGRRTTGAVSLFVASAFAMAFFLSNGALLWGSQAGAVAFSSISGIALATLSVELFPTEVRATANGLLLGIGVLGSAAGLSLSGALSDPLGGLGHAIALLGVPSLVVAAFAVPRLPEPAGIALDEVSPPALGFGIGPTS
jgi:SHS family lactate transporter-like MFS transporter